MSLPPLPAEAVRSGVAGADTRLWDPLRKKLVAHTPEEEVRQRLIFHLLAERSFPPPLMAVERSLRLFGRMRRFDLLVFDRTGKPLLVAECKAPTEVLSPSVLTQTLQYNYVLSAPWILLTNGEQLAVALHQPPKETVWHQSIPTYEDLLT